MHSLKKRHSWPPLHAKKSPSRTPASIDHDPFSYFVSPDSENDSVLQLHLTAGITNRRSHSLPCSPTKTKHNRGLTDKVGKRVAKLRKWVERMQITYLYHSPPRPITQSTSPVPPQTLEDLTMVGRGRDIRCTATSRERARIRTPPRKPRAWRQPSDYIWPVAEESEEVGLGIKCEGMDRPV